MRKLRAFDTGKGKTSGLVEGGLAETLEA